LPALRRETRRAGEQSRSPAQRGTPRPSSTARLVATSRGASSLNGGQVSTRSEVTTAARAVGVQPAGKLGWAGHTMPPSADSSARARSLAVASCANSTRGLFRADPAERGLSLVAAVPVRGAPVGEIGRKVDAQRLPRTLSLDAALAAKKARHRLRLGDARGAGLAQAQLRAQRVRARPLVSVGNARLALHAARTRARESSHPLCAIDAD